MLSLASSGVRVLLSCISMIRRTTHTEGVVMSLPVLDIMTALVLCRATFYLPDKSDKLNNLFTVLQIHFGSETKAFLKTLR